MCSSSVVQYIFDFPNLDYLNFDCSNLDYPNTYSKDIVWKFDARYDPLAMTMPWEPLIRA